MYFPYIRAKQFDLMALTELRDQIYNQNSVIPIVEPVAKIKKGQFKRLMDRNIPFILVVNPIVGDLTSVTLNAQIKSELVDDLFNGYENFIVAFIIHPQTRIG